jgi:hypothetical protein
MRSAGLRILMVMRTWSDEWQVFGINVFVAVDMEKFVRLVFLGYWSTACLSLLCTGKFYTVLHTLTSI